MKRQVILFLAVAGYAAMVLADDAKQSSASPNAGSPNSAASANSPTDFPVIGYLEKRNCVITIKSSPNGTIYSIASKDGKMLHENVSREQLKAQAPELYEVIKSGMANDARLDARAICVNLSLKSQASVR